MNDTLKGISGWCPHCTHCRYKKMISRVQELAEKSIEDEVDEYAWGEESRLFPETPKVMCVQRFTRELIEDELYGSGWDKKPKLQPEIIKEITVDELYIPDACFVEFGLSPSLLWPMPIPERSNSKFVYKPPEKECYGYYKTNEEKEREDSEFYWWDKEARRFYSREENNQETGGTLPPGRYRRDQQEYLR